MPPIKKTFLIITLLTIGVIFLLIGFTPLYPKLAWYWQKPNLENQMSLLKFDETISHATTTADTTTFTVENINPRVIIPSIGVDMLIVTDEDNEKDAFARGAWLLPGTAEPGGLTGNTVIAAHRYMYTSGPNTFYHLDKLKIGDQIIVRWREKDYLYIVRETKIVDPSEISILNPTEKPTLTLFTCHPIYTTKSRLVVVGDLIP
jgi:LPXTG-site transpeptidase (sortase) family protein